LVINSVGWYTGGYPINHRGGALGGNLVDVAYPVRYAWSVRAEHLYLRYVSGTACDGFTNFLTAAWTRVR
jgi:hypothetical protein